MQAIWSGKVIAKSDRTIVVEGNHYFPPDSLNREFFRDSTRTSICPWKGLACYLDVVVGDAVNDAAAWTYPEPEPAAHKIAGYVAFWKGVEIRP